GWCELTSAEPAHPIHPLVWLDFFGARRQRVERLLDRLRVLQARVPPRAQAEQDDLVVAVDDAPDHGAPVQVDSARATFVVIAASVSDGSELRVPDQHRRHDGVLLVHRVDLAVVQPESAGRLAVLVDLLPGWW